MRVKREGSAGSDSSPSPIYRQHTPRTTILRPEAQAETLFGARLQHVALFSTVSASSYEGVRLVYASKLVIRRGVEEGDSWSKDLRVQGLIPPYFGLRQFFRRCSLCGGFSSRRIWPRFSTRSCG